MKNYLTLLLLSSLVFGKLWAATSRVIEIYPQTVFTIPQGLDNNDNAEIVVNGTLPTLCYKLGRPLISIDRSEKVVHLQLTATTRLDNECEDEGKKLEEYQKWPIEFNNVISLGKLSTGNYSVEYMNIKGEKASNTFTIKDASKSSIDDQLYAPISSAFIPELINETEQGEVVVTGIFGLSCHNYIPSPEHITRIGQVIIVVPAMPIPTAPCERKVSALNRVLQVGKLTEGKYLLHIRRPGGQSINRVFTVQKALNDSPRKEMPTMF